MIDFWTKMSKHSKIFRMSIPYLQASLLAFYKKMIQDTNKRHSMIHTYSEAAIFMQHELLIVQMAETLNHFNLNLLWHFTISPLSKIFIT